MLALGLPKILLIKRLCIGLTALCIVWMFFMLSAAYSSKKILPQSLGAVKAKELKEIQLNIEPVALPEQFKTRDIFYAPVPVVAAAAEAPGELPAQVSTAIPSHLKVVGVLIGNPSEVIIEDTNAKQTYFIREGKPQAGIGIEEVNRNEIVIKVEGRNVSIPIGRDAPVRTF